MLFNSYLFIFIFLPLTLFGYFKFGKTNPQTAKYWLAFCSLAFYTWYDYRYLMLLAFSLIANYLIGQRILLNTRLGQRSAAKIYTLAGVSLNLCILGFFKYADFFIQNFNTLSIHQLDMLHLALPLAISFFTFQQIAFLVDIQRGIVQKVEPLNYVLFIVFFPQLIAGPIVHHKEICSQFEQSTISIFNTKNFYKGLFVFSIGLFKKVVIADTFAVWADTGYLNATELNFFSAWFTSLSYTFQLYFDFSAYADMALGAAWMMNLRLPINFNSPYQAASIQDFWRRWHITLSHFLRDYVYIPLGGNKISDVTTSRNLLLTFVLGGLWHGASWMFVLWGAAHGLALILHRQWQKLQYPLPKWLAVFLTFNFINLTWVLFRAEDLATAKAIYLGMLGSNGLELPHFLAGILHPLTAYQVTFGGWISAIGGDLKTPLWMLFALFLIRCKNSMQLASEWQLSKTYAIVTAVLLTLSIGAFEKMSPFLYFNF